MSGQTTHVGDTHAYIPLVPREWSHLPHDRPHEWDHSRPLMWETRMPISLSLCPMSGVSGTCHVGGIPLMCQTPHVRDPHGYIPMGWLQLAGSLKL